MTATALVAAVLVRFAYMNAVLSPRFGPLTAVDPLTGIPFKLVPLVCLWGIFSGDYGDMWGTDLEGDFEMLLADCAVWRSIPRELAWQRFLRLERLGKETVREMLTAGANPFGHSTNN